MKKYAISELVFDFDLYPRGSVDSHHVGEIAAAIEAGSITDGGSRPLNTSAVVRAGTFRSCVVA